MFLRSCKFRSSLFSCNVFVGMSYCNILLKNLSSKKTKQITQFLFNLKYKSQTIKINKEKRKTKSKQLTAAVYFFQESVQIDSTEFEFVDSITKLLLNKRNENSEEQANLNLSSIQVKIIVTIQVSPSVKKLSKKKPFFSILMAITIL